MDKTKALIAAAALAVGFGGGAYLAKKPAESQAQAPAVTGCTTQRMHFSNWSPSHPIDDGPTKEVQVCNGVVVP